MTDTTVMKTDGYNLFFVVVAYAIQLAFDLYGPASQPGNNHRVRPQATIRYTQEKQKYSEIGCRMKSDFLNALKCFL